MTLVFTVGHSTHPIDQFLALLAGAGVGAVADVRSAPYSRFNPQFNRETLRDALKAAGVSYVFLGEELGARSKDPNHYEGGKVSYERLAETDAFRRGIARVLKGAETMTVALMCAEAEPLDCHRTILVARHLARRGAQIRHILRDGTVEAHEETMNRLIARYDGQSGDLFSSRDDRVEEALRRRGAEMAYRPDKAAQTGMGGRGD